MLFLLIKFNFSDINEKPPFMAVFLCLECDSMGLEPAKRLKITTSAPNSPNPFFLYELKHPEHTLFFANIFS